MKAIMPIIPMSLIIVLMSFKSDVSSLIEFQYPKNKTATFTMDTDKFKTFSKEWRGEDYYYMGESTDKKFICSALYYKLNANEQKTMVDPLGGKTSPGIPFLYFSETSNLKKYESNNTSWGEMEDDFMFRQNDIIEFQGVKVNQKHMYAYAMFGKDLFVNVHLSKMGCTPEDSVAMRKILSSLKK